MLKKTKLESEDGLITGPHHIKKEWIEVENNVKTTCIRLQGDNKSNVIGLNNLATNCPSNTQQKPDDFYAVVSRFIYPGGDIFKTPKSIAINVFPSQSVCMGAKDSRIADYTLRLTVDTLDNDSVRKIVANKPPLKNIVLCVKIPNAKINLSALAASIPRQCTYSEENFPGATISIPNHRPKANVFKSGIIVLPGPDNIKYGIKCMTHIYNIVYDFIEVTTHSQ